MVKLCHDNLFKDTFLHFDTRHTNIPRCVFQKCTVFVDDDDRSVRKIHCSLISTQRPVKGHVHNIHDAM